jgi:hypothetical protein
LDDFEREWLKSNSGWYEGICHKTPSQDNGLEVSKNVIKSHHSLRRRLPLGQYLNNAEHMLHQRSVDSTKHKVSEHSVNISFDKWK